jgi:hypothetical protein
MNAFAFIRLQEKVAAKLGVGIGSYSHRSNSMHAYEKDFPLIEGYVKRIETEPEEFVETEEENSTSEPAQTLSTAVQGETRTEPTATTAEERIRISSADFPLTAVRSNPVHEVEEFFEDVLIPPSGPGVATSYEQLAEQLQWDTPLNFVKYEIIGIYTPEETSKITKGDINENITTLYRARLIYDYISQQELDIEINIARAGTATWQARGNPMYEIGDVFVSQIMILNEHLKGESTWCVARLSYTVHEINGMEFAFSVRYDIWQPNNVLKITNSRGQNLDIGVLNSEQSFVTTTRNNPVVYTQKFVLEELTEFIRNDWKERGFELLDFSRFNP